MSVFYRDDLDARVNKIQPSLAFRSDRATLRDNAYAQVIAQYNQELITADDDHARLDNFASPLSTGSSPTVDTASYDIYQVARPAGEIRIAGNYLYLEKATGTFFKVPRVAFDDIIIATGDDQTLYAFYENKGKINLIIKDSEFVDPADFCYNYYRILDDTLPDASTTPLDIRGEDFNDICERVSDLMIENT